MNPNKCPIQGCQFDKRLVLCPLHWDQVDAALKLTVYNLSADLEHAELSDTAFEETTAKLLETEEQIIRILNERGRAVPPPVSEKSSDE